jgi:hypothetical protein
MLLLFNVNKCSDAQPLTLLLFTAVARTANKRRRDASGAWAHGPQKRGVGAGGVGAGK